MDRVTERDIVSQITINFKKLELHIALREPSLLRKKYDEVTERLGAAGFQLVTTADEQWFNENIPCRHACPASTNARGYVMAIAEGRYQEAYLIARKNNPFVATCGKVCGAPCESACQRGQVDESISIRALKDFAVEQNQLSHRETYYWLRKQMGKVKLAARERVSQMSVISERPAGEDISLRSSHHYPSPQIAVIGAGPAGLSAAHDLTLMGYKVKVFEAGSNPGGMPANSLPIYRLDREAVKKDVDSILSLGIQLETNATCGKDFSIDQLREEFDAVIIAVGLQKGRTLPLPGIELSGVLSGLDFLKDAAAGRKVNLREKVIVIGGGCVATDVARTAVRVGMSKEVHLVCLEAGKGCRPDNPKEEMPAWVGDVVESKEEGVIFHTSCGPRRVVGENGKVRGLEVIRVSSVYDAQGRFNPSYMPGTEHIIEADNILLAIGQAPDMSFLQGSEGFELDQRKMLKVDPVTLSTSKPGVFICGDINGPGLVINAVAAGQRAALSAHQYLGGSGSLALNMPGPLEATRFSHRFERFDKFFPRLYTKKMLPALLPPRERMKGWKPVEKTYTERTAKKQGERCLNCNVSPVIEKQATCILCGGCADVCPTRCISMVYLDKAELEPKGSPLLDGNGKGEGLWVGLVHDEELCIHCGLCAYRCPVDAITMMRFEETRGRKDV